VTVVQLGPRSTTDDDVVELFVGCHARIRRFLDLARRLAADDAVDAAEARAAAAAVHRYFTLAFPLHLADEEDLLAHLRGEAVALDAALAQMHADHADHAGRVTRLVAACEAIERDPAAAAARGELGAAAEALAAALEPHLAAEEAAIFPAVRALPRAALDALRAAMIRRRSGGPRSDGAAG
jgi:hemerythrin-like domain-containing protein